MNTQRAVSVLREATRCLDNKYFLCYGTCLGAIREQNIIKHDLDIDIGMMRSDFKLEYINKLIHAGFKLICLFGMLEAGLELSFSKDGIKVDLMIFYQKGSVIWNSLWDRYGKNGLNDMIIHSYKSKLFEIKQRQIQGIPFYSLGYDYIERVYGVNWEEPVTPWNWRIDHMCRDDELKIKLKKQYG